MAKIKYRLALDVGANSLGWCVYRLNDSGEPYAIQRLGSRIFADGRDPKTLASKAADRRMARQMRRRRDRVLKRRHRLIEGLVRFGLMPTDVADRKSLERIDPYALRARGLDERLTPDELGRAIYHLARKRGFKSSRKDGRDAESEKEAGKVHAAIASLRSHIKEVDCRTVGEYLARRHAQRLPVRARRSTDGQYVMYMQRSMVAEEFDALWEAQKRFHPTILTAEARDYLRDTILFQRRLLPVQPGRCLFEPQEYRARLCSPLQQRFRILQELNNIRVKEGIGERALSMEERSLMLDRLDRAPGLITFAQLAKAAGLRNAKQFNFGNDRKRAGLKGNVVAASFASPSALGERWHELPPETQQALAVLVEQADQVEPLVEALVNLPGNTELSEQILGKQHDAVRILDGLKRLPFTIPEQTARTLAGLRLPDDFGSLSLKALARIVAELERDVVTYDVAVARAGYNHHSQFYDGVMHSQLPYYGQLLGGYISPAEKAGDASERRYGKIPNPTVHIGLNQVRQLVNALIKRYGHPHEIVVELAREFGASGEKRREITKQQAEGQARNDRYNAELERLGQAPSRDNRLRLQLWEELGKDDALNRYCIYSGKRLSKAALFSDEVEIDHILPFSRSLHDGVGNKILCVRQGNRDKGNRTPFEAFGHTDRWQEIEQRAEQLPARKRKLFQEGALETFLGDKDFLARHLADTAYLGRAAKQYLSAICPPNCVWVSSGKLTGLVRGKFGLSSLLSGDGRKNRADHRHHALDAAVVGLCSRSLIQRIATAAARAEEKGEQRLLEGLALPWASFRNELRDSLARIVVSHKPDHGKQAALHNDTNYGWRGGPDKRGNPLVGRRVSLDSLKKAADAEGIPDEALRSEIATLLAPLSAAKDIKMALAAYSARTGIRRVIRQERLAVIPIHDQRTGKPYRYVKGDGNYCYEIFRLAGGGWDGRVVNLFQANQEGFSVSKTQAQDGRPLVMRIHKDDMVLVETDEKQKVMRVAQFSTGKVLLVEHHEANASARVKAGELQYLQASVSSLRRMKARLVGVDVLGYVNDPGFSG